MRNTLKTHKFTLAALLVLVATLTVWGQGKYHPPHHPIKPPSYHPIKPPVYKKPPLIIIDKKKKPPTHPIPPIPCKLDPKQPKCHKSKVVHKKK